MEQLGFLNNILDKIKSKSSTVAINISSRSVMEILEFDKTGVITNYASVPIQYNPLTKELENINDFSASIKTTFSELNISMSSTIYLTLPTFMLETAEYPEVDDEEAVKTMLTSAVEKNYFFRKYDPVISFYKSVNTDAGAGNMSLVYTALRADEYNKIRNVFTELGLKVVAIDSSYSALINGVIATQKVNPEILQNNAPWNIINITVNSFTIYSMLGREVRAVYEEPLAVKSFTEEEIYQVITNSLDLVLDKYPANQNIVVSQSDEVSAEYLASVLNVNTPKAFIEDNKYRKQLVELSYNITQSNKTKVSLEAIGIASWPFNVNGFKFNFLSVAQVEETATIESITIPWKGKDVEVTPALLFKWSISAFLIVALILLTGWVLLTVRYNTLSKENEQIASEISSIEAELNLEPKTEGVSEASFLQNSYQNNMNYKQSYSSVAQEIPNMLWIEELQLSDTSKLYLAGRSYKMEDILNYFDSLSKLGKFLDLQISILRVSNVPLSDLLINKNSTMTQETTYEFAFGDSFFKDPRVALPAEGENAENKDGGNNTEQSGDNAVPPPPTNIPKQDKQ